VQPPVTTYSTSATVASALHRIPLVATVPAEARPPLPSASAPPDENEDHHAGGSLDVLTTGEDAKRDAAEFVTSGYVYQVLDELRARSDLVVVDAPPLLPVSDPLIISQHADVMLVVAKVGTLRRTMLTRLRRLLNSTPIRAIALVLTGVDLGDDVVLEWRGLLGLGEVRGQCQGRENGCCRR